MDENIFIKSGTLKAPKLPELILEFLVSENKQF